VVLTIWPAAMNRELEKTSDHEVRAGEKDGAEISKTKNSSLNPKKLGRRLGCNIQKTLNIDNKSDHESDASVKSKHSRKRKRVSKPDREATAHKKRKDRSKKRRYDTDYSSSSENESDVISLHSTYLSSDPFFAGQTREFRLFLPLTRYFLVTRRVMK